MKINRLWSMKNWCKSGPPTGTEPLESPRGISSGSAWQRASQHSFYLHLAHISSSSRGSRVCFHNRVVKSDGEPTDCGSLRTVSNGSEGFQTAPGIDRRDWTAMAVAPVPDPTHLLILLLPGTRKLALYRWLLPP